LTGIGNRSSTIFLYSDADPLSWAGLCSHRVRLVLAEKGIVAEIIPVEADQKNAELLQLNPAGTCPTLVDRDLTLYDARVITDYLDERYPHPPLMPVDPVSRAQSRLALHRIESDWYSLLPCWPHLKMAENDARQALVDSLVEANDVFAALPYFFGEEYSILDATLAPLLWRLRAYGIVVPDSATALTGYAQRMFARPGFQSSLTKMERDMVQ